MARSQRSIAVRYRIAREEKAKSQIIVIREGNRVKLRNCRNENRAIRTGQRLADRIRGVHICVRAGNGTTLLRQPCASH
jgi:hypothetical protein